MLMLLTEIKIGWIGMKKKRLSVSEEESEREKSFEEKELELAQELDKEVSGLSLLI
jgi:hypothetical protein